MNTNLLANIPLFHELPSSELEHLQGTMQVKDLEPGEILFREGQVGNRFYVIADGQLEILMGAETPEEMVLNVISTGEYLGEMSLIMPGGERTATARARVKTVLLSMDRDEFIALLGRHPLLAKAMVSVLSERLESTNDATFRDLTEKNRALQKAYDELKAAQEQLIEKERLERELQVAAEIQLSILPTVLPSPPSCDFGARILPARQVGGDFYDVFRVDENKIVVLIGDVTDKGVPAAIFMARAHALIIAESDSSKNPEQVLRRVNAHITKLEKTSQFVTVTYGILDINTYQFTYARAGHEPALLLDANGTVTRIPHKPGMAIGLWNDIALDVDTITLPPNATLFIYTDGMTDCRNPGSEAFGLDKTMRTLAQTVDMPAQQVCDHMMKTLKDYQLNAPQDDDVTLVAVHTHVKM
jgi:sigma-B regulation protein RsbU (phosphoserine phosphatase)